MGGSAVPVPTSGSAGALALNADGVTVEGEGRAGRIKRDGADGPRCTVSTHSPGDGQMTGQYALATESRIRWPGRNR